MELTVARGKAGGGVGIVTGFRDGHANTVTVFEMDEQQGPTV